MGRGIKTAALEAPASSQRTFVLSREGFALLLTALYTAVIVFGHWHHEMWGDELHCWLVGRTSTGLLDVLLGPRRLEGHPFLWYYLLHLLSRVHDSVTSMRVLTVLSAAASVYVLARYSPFGRRLSALLAGGYFLLYEYTVLSRSYVLGVLLTFVFCARLEHKRDDYVRHALILALLANTSAYGAILAVCFAAILFLRPLSRDEGGARTLTFPRTRAWWLGVALLGAGLLFAVWHTLPPAESATHARVVGLTLAHAGELLEHYWRAMVPVLNWRVEYGWNSNFLIDEVAPAVRAPVFLYALLLGCAWVLAMRRRPWIAVVYVGTCLVMFAFQHFAYGGVLRHFGHFYLLTLACAWMLWREAPGEKRPRALRWLMLGTAGVQFVGALLMLRLDYQRTFAGGEEVVRYLRAHGLAELPIVGTSEAMPAYLGREIYYPARGQFGAVIPWDTTRRPASDEEILEGARTIATERSQPVIIVVDRPIPSGPMAGLLVEHLLSTAPGLVPWENYHLYRATVSR